MNDAGPSETSMIDVIFNQHNNDIFLELRVKSFDLILSIDFVDKLKVFFELPNADDVEDELKEATLKVLSTTTAGPPSVKGKLMLIPFYLFT